MQDVALYGARGQVGAVLAEHFGDRALRIEEGDAPAIRDTVIWCATYPPPHHVMSPRIKELTAFLSVLERCEGVKRVIFTSSHGVSLIGAGNAYAAGKLAGRRSPKPGRGLRRGHQQSESAAEYLSALAPMVGSPSSRRRSI